MRDELRHRRASVHFYVRFFFLSYSHETPKGLTAISIGKCLCSFQQVKYRLGLCCFYLEHNIDQFTPKLLSEKSNKRACWSGWKAGDGVQECLRSCAVADDVFLCALDVFLKELSPKGRTGA